MPGFPLTQNRLDQRMGDAVVSLRNALREVVAIRNLLTDTDLLGAADGSQMAALGYSAADITLINAAFTDLAALAATALGNRAQPAPSNFFSNAKRIAGADWVQ